MRALLIVIALLAPVAATARPKVIDRDKPLAWRGALQPRDHNRLHNWRQAWLEGLATAKSGGAAAKIAAEGALLNPDAAANDPTVPDGAYRCRTIKLGAAAVYREDAAVPCTFDGGHFRERGGVQRIDGYLWRYDGIRQLMLGALSVGDEHGSLPYGRDQQRDVLGLFERIGPQRWRLAIPRPAWEAAMVVVEITPAS